MQTIQFKQPVIFSVKNKILPSVRLLVFIANCLFLSAKSQNSGAFPATNALRQNTTYPACGSNDLMHHIDQKNSQFSILSGQLMEIVSQQIANRTKSRSEDDLYIIPVVFHVVYNNEAENLPDSVILNQLHILNTCFRRQNANASETRTEFLDVVGDTKVEFRMASSDPLGMPTNGITRTSTEVEYFGGVLPYGPGQNSQVIQWTTDSLFFNFFRLTNPALGGHEAWDTERYLNVWIGDLRILEPAFDDFEELVYFGLATPPIDHPNWPPELIGQANDFEQGVLMHYVNVGENNPNSLPAPYTAYNGVTTTGKMLVHEVGHYLGLRHIWGDGNCDFDDYIYDTPNSDSESAWNCNFNLNSCVDNIGGADLPNMVENYMDYSSGACQNSFTIGQGELIRAVLEGYRPMAYELVPASMHKLKEESTMKCYPNPGSGKLNIDFGSQLQNVEICIQNEIGQIVLHTAYKDVRHVNLNLTLPKGLYLLIVDDKSGKTAMRKLLIAQDQ